MTKLATNLPAPSVDTKPIWHFRRERECFVEFRQPKKTVHGLDIFFVTLFWRGVIVDRDEWPEFGYHTPEEFADRMAERFLQSIEGGK